MGNICAMCSKTLRSTISFLSLCGTWILDMVLIFLPHFTIMWLAIRWLCFCFCTSEKYRDFIWDPDICQDLSCGNHIQFYCFYRKNPKQATFIGSLVYIFAGWTIYASMKHPYFSNPMIYLPLVLMGVEKVYKKEKPYLFIWVYGCCGQCQTFILLYDLAYLWCCMRLSGILEYSGNVL